MNIAGYGLQVDIPTGWEGRIYKHKDDPKEPHTRFPIVHAASFPLPGRRGDYGSGAVKLMSGADIFLAIIEFGPKYVGVRTFAPVRTPAPEPVSPGDLSPRALQYYMAGHRGMQRFFVFEGKAFCLYLVAGSAAVADATFAEANQVISSLTLV